MKLIAYGKILKPHGLKGEVKVLPYSGEPENFKNFRSIYLFSKNSEKLKYDISGCRFQKSQIIVKFQDVDTVEEAENLRGKELFVDKKVLPRTEENEYYFFELIGLDVYNQKKDHLGKVESIIDNTAQPVLVIKNSSDEFMVPLVDKFVKKIDLDNSKIEIEPIEGLI